MIGNRARILSTWFYAITLFAFTLWVQDWSPLRWPEQEACGLKASDPGAIVVNDGSLSMTYHSLHMLPYDPLCLFGPEVRAQLDAEHQTAIKNRRNEILGIWIALFLLASGLTYLLSTRPANNARAWKNDPIQLSGGAPARQD